MGFFLTDWQSEWPLALLGLSAEWSSLAIAALTALVTTIAAAPVRLLVEKRLQRSQVEIEYEHEQRKALRAKIGIYHGRLLEAALDLNYRLVNLNTNWKAGWLNADGSYRNPPNEQHYLRTTAFRFIRLAGIAGNFEREAIIVDARIADGSDQAFVRYPKAFRWVVTDVALYRGLDYDPSSSGEHFFTDHLRQLCSLAWGSAVDLEFTQFEELIASSDGLDELLRFFDGIEPGQLRWDRLASLQLLLMAFINTFGYDYQVSDDAWFDAVAEQIGHVEVLTALQAWIPKLGLGVDSGTRSLLAALARRSRDLV